MDSDWPFRIALVAILFGFVAHRGYYLRRQHEATVHDRPVLATAFAGLASIATLVYLIHPPAMAWSSVPMPSPLRWSGLLLALAGFLLLSWAQQALGEQWSTAAQVAEQRRLVTNGPYRRVRHPIYAAFLLIFGAPLLLTANCFIGTAWFAMAALEAAHRMGKEETLLLSAFGEEYRAYRETTGRLLPRTRPTRPR